MQKKLQGVTDAPLTVHGMTGQAAALGRHLSLRPPLASGKPRISRIVASPLQRAYQTAMQIKHAQQRQLGIDIDLQTNVLLQERDFGSLEDTIYGNDKEYIVQVGGETKDAFRARVRLAFDPYLRECAMTDPADQSELVIVTHGVVISAFMKLFAPQQIAMATNTGRFVFRVYPDLTLSVLMLNDIDHLSDVKRQRGGIGSAAYDEKQSTLTAFFTKRT